ACGTPVVSSRAGSLPEVIGEAGLYFEATDIDSIAAAIRTILASPSHRDTLARAAIARSALFTWEESARRLVACFDEVSIDRAKPATQRSACRRFVPRPPQTRAAVQSCPRPRRPIRSVG